MRYKENKRAVIIDHVGNVHRFGLPDTDREWSLESTTKKKKSAETEIKGVILFHHGLAEHSLRYDRFGSICAENGYVLNVYDMRGHGKTCELNNAIYGKLADKNGFNRALQDFEEVKISLEKDFESKKIFFNFSCCDDCFEYCTLHYMLYIFKKWKN